MARRLKERRDNKTEFYRGPDDDPNVCLRVRCTKEQLDNVIRFRNRYGMSSIAQAVRLAVETGIDYDQDIDTVLKLKQEVKQLKETLHDKHNPEGTTTAQHCDR